MMSRSRSKSENAVEAEIIGFLQPLGWRPTRNHVGVFAPVSTPTIKVRIGVEGFPDWTFTRKGVVNGSNQLFHMEAKRPGQKPSAKQHEVMASLNHIGELAVWADSLERFKEIYAYHYGTS